MTGGAFQTSREIFDNPIWQDVTKFRIFFFIVGNAVFSEEGVRKGDILISRGQFLRSYRNLQTDLEYFENRKVKQYSISVISRKIDSLIKEERLKIESTELGTLFTVVNYDMYQGFEHYKKQEPGTALEQGWNSVGTVLEQSGNNNKKVNKEKKDNLKDYTSKIKDLSSCFSSIVDFNKLSKRYWDVIRETRTTGKISESVIFNAMSKWTKYDPIVVQYALKTHIEAHAGKKEEYTLGIMRGTTKDEAEDRLNKKVSIGSHAKQNAFKPFDGGIKYPDLVLED